MKNVNLLLLVCLFTLLYSTAHSQTAFGLKAGMNLSKYSGNSASSNYKYKPGFYAGGFANFNLGEKFELQPELLFALQGSNFVIEDIEVRESQDELPKRGDFKTKTTETTISVPVVARYFASKEFYLEAGPQLGIILDRKEEITESPSDDPDINVVQEWGNNTFDFGLAMGAGYHFTNALTANFRYFLGLAERDVSKMKSSVLNLGIEFRL